MHKDSFRSFFFQRSDMICSLIVSISSLQDTEHSYLIGRSTEAYRIKDIISNTELLVAEESGEPSPLHDKFLIQASQTNAAVGSTSDSDGNNSEPAPANLLEYDILGFIDQGKMFEVVKGALAQGNNLGIFPEGGSHDNTDLLPLKAGK